MFSGLLIRTGHRCQWFWDWLFKISSRWNCRRCEACRVLYDCRTGHWMDRPRFKRRVGMEGVCGKCHLEELREAKN